MAASYHLCRWYDPYPKLAFALKLLYLAPEPLQVSASRALQRFLADYWEAAFPEGDLRKVASGPKGKRWYDEHVETAETVELIKSSPETLKTLAAETLLEILAADSASL